MLGDLRRLERSQGTNRVTIPPSKLAATAGAMPSSAAARLGEQLRLAADPEQVGVLAVQAHDVVLPAEAHAVVAVRDPALERRGLAADSTQ